MGSYWTRTKIPFFLYRYLNGASSAPTVSGSVTVGVGLSAVTKSAEHAVGVAHTVPPQFSRTTLLLIIARLFATSVCLQTRSRLNQKRRQWSARPSTSGTVLEGGGIYDHYVNDFLRLVSHGYIVI